MACRASLWPIIERVQRASGGALGPACAAFRLELDALSDSDLARVVVEFSQAMVDLRTYPVWGAAAVIHGGCPDDTFWDFRAGVVALGREVFEAALADPDSLASVDDLEERTLFEGFQYVPHDVVEARGIPDPGGALHGPGPATGTEWTESELPSLYPRLAARFGAP